MKINTDMKLQKKDVVDQNEAIGKEDDKIR